MSMDKGYSVRIAVGDDKDSVVELLRSSFVMDEPLSSSAPTPTDPANMYSLKILANGISAVATTSYGSIMGVCINMEGTPASYAERTRIKQSSTNPHMKKIFTLLEKAEEVANIRSKYGIDRIFDIRVLAVHASMRGKGIGMALVEKSLKIAKERGYKLVHMECTGFYSARIAEQLGMECVFRIPYSEYKDNAGQPIFNVLEPHTDMKWFILKL